MVQKPRRIPDPVTATLAPTYPRLDIFRATETDKTGIYVNTINTGITPTPTPTPTPVTISCLGDSITNGYPYGLGDPQQAIEKTYPSVLQSNLDDQFGAGHFTVINHGINGLKAEGLRTNLQTLGWLNENPSIVLVMIGGNDLAAAETVSEFMQIAQETVEEVQDCVDIIKAHVNPDGHQPEIIVSAFPLNRLGVLANWGIAYYNTLLNNQFK